MISDQRAPNERIAEDSRLRVVDLLHAIDDNDWDEAIRLARLVARVIEIGRVRIKS